MAKFQDHQQVAKENNIGSSGEFYRLEKGDNKIRILSEYEPIGKHFIKEEKKSYVCIGKDDGCQYCQSGNKPNVKFLLWVLDRKDSNVKLAEFGYSIIKAIGELSTNEDWSFEIVPDYDITIKKTGEGLDTEYHVVPSPKKEPLNEDVQNQIKEKVKNIQEIVSKMKEKAGGSPSIIQVEDIEVEDADMSDIKAEEIPF